MPFPSLYLPALIFCLPVVGACGASIERKPPGMAPSAETISKERPGGDAHDPHAAALKRQLEESWGWRSDKDRQAQFPLPDRTKWTRVRFRFVDHLVGFKYGDEHHALSAGVIVPLEEGDPRTSRKCIERFEESALPKVEFYGGQITDFSRQVGQWKGQELVLRKATGSIDFLFHHYEVSVAWTGYPAYPDSCLIYGVAVLWEGQQELAEDLRDKWMGGLHYFHPLTESEPFRH